MIAGTVMGNLVAAGRVELLEQCLIRGDIQAGRMKLGEGAQVEGYLRVGSTASEATPD